MPAYFRTTQDVAGLVGPTALSPRLDTQVRCLRINVTVREGQTTFRLSAVVAPPGGAGLPPADPPTTDADEPAGANRTPGGNTPAPSSAATTTANTTAAAQTQATLNYPFTLLEIRENDEITGTFSPSQPAPE